MADVPAIIPGAGGADTLLILGILGGGAYILWRKGVFASPDTKVPTASPPASGVRRAAPAVRDPALPAPSTVAGVPSVSPPVTDAQRNVLSPLRRLAGAIPTAVAPSSASSYGDISVSASALVTSKPPPVPVSVGVTSSSLMAAPSPLRKLSSSVVSVGYRPPPVTPPPAPAPPRLAPSVLPVSRPTMVVPTKPKVAIKPVAKPFPLQVGFRR